VVCSRPSSGTKIRHLLHYLIGIEFRQVGADARIGIKDAGIGIDPEQREGYLPRLPHRSCPADRAGIGTRPADQPAARQRRAMTAPGQQSPGADSSFSLDLPLPESSKDDH
jgi:hypothetical protein